MTVKQLIVALTNASSMDSEVIISVKDKETMSYHSAKLDFAYDDTEVTPTEIILVGNKEE